MLQIYAQRVIVSHSFIFSLILLLSNASVIAKCCSRFDSVRVIESFLRRCGGVTGRLTETVSPTPMTGDFELQKQSLEKPVNMVKIEHSDYRYRLR